MKPRILYWISNQNHDRIISQLVERNDIEQAIIVPKIYFSESIRLKHIFRYKHEQEIKQIIEEFKPNLFVQSSTTSKFYSKLQECKSKMAYIGHGIYKNDLRGIQKIEHYGLKHFDLLCVGSNKIRDIFKNYIKEDALIVSSALLQFDTLYHVIKKQNILRNRIIKLKSNFDKIITFFGHKCTGRSTSIPHNESYYRTAICLAELAKKYNWLVCIKPKREDIDNFIQRLYKTKPEYSWADELLDKYLDLKDNNYVQFVSPYDDPYSYFCSDVIVNTGCSTIEVEAILAKKPLVKICTNYGEPEDIHGTLKHSTAYPVYDINDLEDIVIRALSKPDEIMVKNQSRFIKNLGITFDGLAYERICSAMNLILQDISETNNIYEMGDNMGEIKQIMSEWREFLNIPRPESKWALDLGTFRGLTARSLCARFDRVVSIDFEKRHFKKLPNCTYLIGNSHNQKTLERVEKILDGQLLDLLFIDGDHTYEGVKTDFNLYNHLVKSKGIIGLHDIVDSPRHRRKGCDVYRFWQEIKDQYKHREIIHDGKWAGIGTIWIP